MQRKRMKAPDLRLAVGALAAFAMLAILCGPSLARSPLGIGTAEPSAVPAGPLAGALLWINAHQQAFYRSLTEALKAMRDDGSKLWVLVGLSFAYGIFHAAGPGHGKAVISSYMVANEVELRRGVLLSFVSSLAQAATAFLLMAAVFLFLRGTAVTMTDATTFLQNASFALVAAFGAWLLWRKGRQLLSGRSAHAHHHHDDHAHEHHNGHHHEDHHHGHAHGTGDTCAACGHSHAPDPKMLADDAFDWRTAWSAVAAVGLRPCSGALIVLTFAILNGLWLGGIVSVLAMALGTAITVSALATLAVVAKNRAVAFAGGGRFGTWVHNAIEIGGAALVFLLGVTLLAASLAG